MPNIEEYKAPQLGLQPSEVGVEATARAGLRVGAFYNQVKQAYTTAGERVGQAVREAGDTAVDYMDHQQINAGADHGATLFANLTDSWNKTSAGADPHDPSVANKWREEQLEPALKQFQEGFTTEKSQEWASRFVNNMREHMFTKTEADMSSLAKDAVSQTVNNMATRLSNAAVRDPSSVGASIDFLNHSIDGILGANPNIKGTDAGRLRLEVGDKIKKQIIHAGAMGDILNSRDPEAAAARWAQKYPDYINGPEELQLAKAAKTQARTNTLITKQAAIADRQLAEQNLKAESNKSWTRNVTVDENNHVNINPQFFKDAVELPLKFPNAPNATEHARTLLNWGEQQQSESKVPDDPATASALNLRMFDLDKPTTKIEILQAENAHKISRATSTTMRQLVDERDKDPIKDPMFKIGMEGAKELIEGRDASERMLQAGKFAAFQQKFFELYKEQKANGTLPPNALDLNDDKSLISQTMKSYRSPLAKVLGAGIPANGGVAPARKFGDVTVPAALGGVAALQYNKSTGQWRDQSTGVIYDSAGKEIKR